MASNKKREDDARVQNEMDAMKVVYAALAPLEVTGQQWVIDCVAGRLGLNSTAARAAQTREEPEREIENHNSHDIPGTTETRPSTQEADHEGLSAVALKWMRRNGLNTTMLSQVFSLGLDEIELVAKSVPGASKREKMRNVFLLTCVASYLATGAARVKYDAVKQACLHYGAYDQANFASYLKAFGRDVGGTKQSGYALTAAGLTAGTELIKSMVPETK